MKWLLHPVTQNECVWIKKEMVKVCILWKTGFYLLWWNCRVWCTAWTYTKVLFVQDQFSSLRRSGNFILQKIAMRNYRIAVFTVKNYRANYYFSLLLLLTSEYRIGMSLIVVNYFSQTASQFWSVLNYFIKTTFFCLVALHYRIRCFLPTF